MSKLQEEENGRDEVDDFEGGAPVVDEDAFAAPDAGCQRKAADRAPPADRDPLNLQGALPLHSDHEEEKAEQRWSSCAKLTDSGRLRIFQVTTTRRKSGSSST